MKGLALLVLMLLIARLHLTVWLPCGVPVCVPVLWLEVAVCTVTGAVALGVAWAVPRAGWPRLAWKTAAA